MVPEKDWLAFREKNPEQAEKMQSLAVAVYNAGAEKAQDMQELADLCTLIEELPDDVFAQMQFVRPLDKKQVLLSVFSLVCKTIFRLEQGGTC